MRPEDKTDRTLVIDLPNGRITQPLVADDRLALGMIGALAPVVPLNAQWSVEQPTPPEGT